MLGIVVLHVNLSEHTATHYFRDLSYSCSI